MQYNGFKRKWWKEQVVYQIYPRSFKDSNGDGIGDIQGIISELDYLKDLGVDIIWLSPHFDSPNADNGYDIRDYRKVMEEFGTMADFDEMLAGIKTRDMRLIIDLVVNHSSDEHEWFQQAKSSKENPYRDYYIWKPGKGDQPPTNYRAFFGGSAWEQAGPDGEYYLHYFAKKQPDLNWENPKLRAEVYELMRFWLDKGVDGFRMDVIPLISKDQSYPDLDKETLKHPETFYAAGPRLHEFLHEMHREVMSRYDVFSVGECFGISAARASRMTDERSQELDLAFIFDIARVGRDNWRQTGWTLPEWKALFSIQANTDRFHWPTVFLTNHDNPRSVSSFGNDSPEQRERSAKLLALLLLTQKGTPFLYQGEEIGMTNYHFTDFDQFDDVEVRGMYPQVTASGVSPQEYLDHLNQTGRDHCRTPMQWSDESNAGFTEGEASWFRINPNYTEINVKANQQASNSVLAFYQQLIGYRKNNLDLIYGDYHDIDPEHPQIFAFTRTTNKATHLVVLNMSDDEISYKLDPQLEGFEPIIGTDAEPPKVLTPETIQLSGWEGRLYVKQH